MTTTKTLLATVAAAAITLACASSAMATNASVNAAVPAPAAPPSFNPPPQNHIQSVGVTWDGTTLTATIMATDYFSSYDVEIYNPSNSTNDCEGVADYGISLDLTLNADDPMRFETSTLTIDGVSGQLKGNASTIGGVTTVTFSSPVLTQQINEDQAIDIDPFDCIHGSDQSNKNTLTAYFNGKGLITPIKHHAEPHPSGSNSTTCDKNHAETAILNSPGFVHAINRYTKGAVSVLGPNGFVVGRVICKDLTGSGKRDMTVMLVCCTVSSPTPLAIFKPTAQGWRLAYSNVDARVWTVKTRGRALVIKRAKYRATDALCCPSAFTHVHISYRGGRFRLRNGL